MPVSFGGVTARKPQTVTYRQLESAWNAAVEAMERSLKRELKIIEQEAWLERNTEHKDYSDNMRKTLYNRDDWYVSYLGRFDEAVAVYGRLAERADADCECAMYDLSPWSLHGALGLRQLHSARARELGIGVGQTLGILETELPW